MSAPAKAKFQSLRGQNAGFPAKQPVKYSILNRKRCVGSLGAKVTDPRLTQFAPSELVWESTVVSKNIAPMIEEAHVLEYDLVRQQFVRRKGQVKQVSDETT